MFNTLDIIHGWAALEKLGKVQLTVETHYPWQKSDQERLEAVAEVIRQLPNFNRKDNYKIAAGFEKFYEQLPLAYRKDCPQDQASMYVFDHITLEGDDTIILYGVVATAELEKWQRSVDKLLTKYQYEWRADEARLLVDNNCFKGYSHVTIRLWWD